MSRKLVSIETVHSVEPIKDADQIEQIKIRGWTVVAKRGEFQVGQRCVYFELDCFLPSAEPAFAFLAARGQVTRGDGVTGHVLRTAKLRGIYSQGLALPLDAFGSRLNDKSPGDDVTELLGIEKWEPPVPAGADIVGPFPSQLVAKTDAERVQNLADAWSVIVAHPGGWFATEKIDGTSTTFGKVAGELIVASRNWQIALSGAQAAIAESHQFAPLLAEGEAIQGELFGAGIQGNPLKINGVRFAAFAFWRNRALVALADWPSWAAALAVPRLPQYELPATIDEVVAQADGIKSAVSPAQLAEGIVWHANNGQPLDELERRSCFKAISNKWLLKHGG
jgi:RNA ligase (TIGR02306 family)